MRRRRGGQKLECAGPPSPLGELAAVGGGDGRISPDLVVDLSTATTEVHAGEGGTSMTAFAPLGVDRSRPRTRSITLKEGHPRNDGVFSELPVNQKRKKTCGETKTSKNIDTPPAGPIPELSDEIVMVILLRLPVKSLLLCKSVCKGWQAIVTDPFFVRTHLKRSVSRCEQDPCFLITPRSVGRHFISNHIRFYQRQQGASMATLMHKKELDSAFFRSVHSSFAQCDGLLLVPTNTRFYLFNPATRESISLPDRDSNGHHSSIWSFAWLGLDPHTGKHKVVGAFYRSIDPGTGIGTNMGMEVFTVSGNSNDGSAWREIKDELPFPAANWNTGKAVNGFLFWRLARNHRDLPRPWGLLRLSLADETFGITGLPDSLRPSGLELDVLHGALCMSVYISKDTVTMWFLPIQEDGGQGQTWEQRHTVHLSCVYRPLAFLPCGQMLLYTDSKVCLYDVATVKLTTVCQLNHMNYQGRRARRSCKNILDFNVHLYTESLVRISL